MNAAADLAAQRDGDRLSASGGPGPGLRPGVMIDTPLAWCCCDRTSPAAAQSARDPTRVGPRVEAVTFIDT